MDKLKSIFKWFGARLSERSSWLGLTAVLASVGVSISPDLQDVIVQIGISVAGLITFLTRDKVIVATPGGTPIATAKTK